MLAARDMALAPRVVIGHAPGAADELVCAVAEGWGRPPVVFFNYGASEVSDMMSDAGLCVLGLGDGFHPADHYDIVQYLAQGFGDSLGALGPLVCSTLSPYLVDAAPAAGWRVFVACRDSAGVAHAVRADDVERRCLHLGEWYFAAGEEWAAEELAGKGCPAAGWASAAGLRSGREGPTAG